MNITFDTNCLVDLELNEGAASELRRIVAAHDSGRCSISVPGIGASERLKDGTFAQNFSVFQQRISNLSRREFEILKPILYLDLAYLDWAIFGGEETIELEQQIHEILFPETLFRWADEAVAHGLDPNQVANLSHRQFLKWRNRKCDTLAMWCHIYYRKDVFVSRDRNFHKTTKKAALERIGAKQILHPAEINL